MNENVCFLLNMLFLLAKAFHVFSEMLVFIYLDNVTKHVMLNDQF